MRPALKPTGSRSSPTAQSWPRARCGCTRPASPSTSPSPATRAASVAIASRSLSPERPEDARQRVQVVLGDTVEEQALDAGEERRLRGALQLEPRGRQPGVLGPS